MRRIRLRIRLKRPSALTGTGREGHPEPPADNLPGREFPPGPRRSGRARAVGPTGRTAAPGGACRRGIRAAAAAGPRQPGHG